MLFEIFGAELQTLYGGVIHPVAVAFQNHGIYADSKRLCHQAVEIHIAGTQLHAVGFQNRRHGAARNAGAAVVDMPQLHAGPQTLHPRKGVGAALGKPVAVKLKVDELRVGFLQQNVVGTLFGVDMTQLTAPRPPCSAVRQGRASWLHRRNQSDTFR